MNRTKNKPILAPTIWEEILTYPYGPYPGKYSRLTNAELLAAAEEAARVFNAEPVVILHSHLILIQEINEELGLRAEANKKLLAELVDS